MIFGIIGGGKLGATTPAPPPIPDTYPTPDMSIITTWGQKLSDMAKLYISQMPSLTLTPSQVALAMNSQLGTDQKLYKDEVLQAAKLISDRYADYPGGYNVWSIEMMNKLGWRIVSFTACPSGKILDPVKRVCINEFILPDEGETVVPPPPEEKKDYTMFIAIGIVALALFMRR